MDHTYPKTLGWHETLEMYELVAFQSIGLMKLKIGLNNIQDSNLQRIYLQTMNSPLTIYDLCINCYFDK